MEEELEFSPEDAMAKLRADEDQNTENLVSVARQLGKFYKELRRNSIPRKLAMEMTHEFFSITMGSATLSTLLDAVDNDDDD